MDQYHIYEAIGRGKYSTVYKGRKKKSIEYHAIKSVDKSHKSKVLQEVRILNSLDHSHVLKFYSWYETSAHLWLILEYCVGGDLRSLLQQDVKLPEDSVHDFARDLVIALIFLHSKEIIYCDLKPSNILLDENGRTKLCDFGLARKLGDIIKTPASLLPQMKRGTPFYMAPELFQDGGVHSFASDLWALGCVLYECYVGNPPFIAKEFTQLVQSILQDPTPSLPGTPSRPFVNLINSLLVKDPAERIQWAELCKHAFWRTEIPLLPLPPQPAFSNMIELFARPHLTERNREHQLRSKTPTKLPEKGTRGHKQDENSTSGLRGLETPAKGMTGGRRTQTKASSKVIEGKQRDASSNARGVNLLRLSRIAKTNLQRENEKENYRRPLPNGPENDAEVIIENTDMELDFNENAEDEAHDDPDASDNVGGPEEHVSTVPGNSDQLNNDNNQVSSSPMINTPTSEDAKTSDMDTSPEDDEVAPTPPIFSPQIKARRAKEGLERAIDPDNPKSCNDISNVLWHPSDLSVRPVMPVKKVDKISIPSLPFDAIPAVDFAKMPKDQLEKLNQKIIGILGSTTAVEKQNAIKYLETLSSNADAANILTKGPIMTVLVKMLRQPKALALRVQITSLIGSLIRHSTHIDDSLANSGILDSLTSGLRDRQEKVRRFSMAALGELLFYISTQGEHNQDNNPPESPSKDGRHPSGWQVSSPLISLVSSLLRKGEDDLTQLYALRTIENVCSQGGQWSSRFTSQDVISDLGYIFKAAGKQESMRLTAGSCLVRLVRFNPPIIQQVIGKLPFRDIASALVKGSPRGQQICLNLLNKAFIESHMCINFERHVLSLVEEKNLIPCLVSLVEQGSEVLKGKALVFVALLCKNGKRWLPHFFCNARLLSAVDRLVKEKDSYVQLCLNAFVHVVASTIPSFLEVITGDIQQILGARQVGIPLRGRATPRTNFHLFPVVYNLLGSSSFKRRLVTKQVVQQLATLIKLVESPFQGRDDFQITLLRVLESITEEASIILENLNTFIREILPSLAVVYKDNKDGDARFLCLKIMFDVMVIFFNEPSVTEEQSLALKTFSNSHFLPLYPTLIEDEDPIPVYAQKLLLMLIEFSFIKIADILNLKIISKCFDFLLGDLSTANVNNVLLCFALASAPELESKILSQLKVVRKIGNLLEFIYAKEMEDFIEPTLGLCRAFLLRSASNRKNFVHTKEPTLLDDGFSEGNYVKDQQQCIRDIMDLGNNVGVLLEISKSHEPNIVDIASECIILLLKAAPREATMGFLSNLSKVSSIIESWHKESSRLVVHRMLHALGFSCRQYISQAMILSIPVSEISRIENIVSKIKSSAISGISDAAFKVAMELQRLPRCI